MNVSRKGTQMNLTKRNKDIIFVCLMLLLPVIQFVVFWIVPNIDSILMAFQHPGKTSFTLINFERFWRELNLDGGRLKPSIVNTLIYFFFVNFINLPLVIFFSFILFKKIFMHKVFRVVFYLPAIIGSSVMAGLFRYIVSSGGPVEQLLDAVGVEYNKQLGLLGNPGTAFIMVLIYSLWTGVGINMILLTGAMNRIPGEIFESARIDGVGFWREFFEIVCPLIWPTVTTLLVLGIAGVFTAYAPVMLLTPNVKEASTLGWYIVQYTMTAGTGVTNEVYNYPAAVGLVFTAIGLPIVLAVKKLCDSISSAVEY